MFYWLNIGNMNDLRKWEGNMVKRALYVPTRCHSTDFFRALNISNTKKYIKFNKQSLLIRLNNNEFTSEMLKISLNSNMDDDFISETIALNDVEYDELTIEALLWESAKQISEYNGQNHMNSKHPFNETVDLIRKVLKSQDTNKSLKFSI